MAYALSNFCALVCTYSEKKSNGNVTVRPSLCISDPSDDSLVAACKKCTEYIKFAGFLEIPEGLTTFCEEHRHEAHKVDTNTVAAVSGKVIDGYEAAFKFGFQSQSSDNNTDLVLAVAKASNFNVNVQGRANAFRTQYRLYCSICHTDMDLGTRAITKQEIENPVTITSKFCIEHAHRPNIKVPDTANYRKFREE